MANRNGSTPTSYDELLDDVIGLASPWMQHIISKNKTLRKTEFDFYYFNYTYHPQIHPHKIAYMHQNI